VAILVNQDTRVLIQGITGNQGRYHTLRMKEYNVQVVAGSTPGRSGQQVVGVPVYDSVAEAAAHHHIDASMILVPPAGVLPAAAEAFESAIPLVVIITEFVPFHDALLIRRLSDDSPSRVIGPNTIGVISPGKGKVGVMPGFIYSEGHVGLISRSGTLTHEIASNLTYKGIGQSTCVCIGGDMVNGTNFIDILKAFREDSQTEKVIIIGEIGGAGEEIAARYIKETAYPKPVIAYIAGMTAPKEKKMGHAGAIVSRGVGTAESKIGSLAEAGVSIARNLDELLAFAA
jgi:succinyl-CoA synthetase alpha subunit